MKSNRKRATTRTIGAVLIAVGLATPQIIDRYEAANHLDIARDIGVLPWMIMTGVGAVILLLSFVR